jgi:hypothetical protein
MEIPVDEYESPRHVFELWRWINTKLNEIDAEPDPDAILLGRQGKTGRIVKRLIEEAIPIACLGLHFYRPLTEVHIKCLAGSQAHDAELEVSGNRSLFYLKARVA